ncbi:MAG: tRNA (adenosine(37)-N6)-threonylcarbamoyltransferase complex ATPase subunit type 1 TsaE [Bacteroidales bacterium]|jgi:tRNA threonylcarbamoyladenosine biosynthesis protein TsaE|nr:tRNA (adenosine(37)-N6)-threonylcarbamoyltransferase complex ATPase subunit type 1 TsaE [Bacteroidales bacterium]
MESLILKSLSDLNIVADKFLRLLREKKVFAFFGSMGVGKTTFIKALCNELGVVEIVTSPTFALINEYQTGEGDTIYHFDFYRINKIEEVYDFGYEDYFFSGHYCFIEWPDKVAEILPDNVVYVQMLENEDGSRTINIR